MEHIRPNIKFNIRNKNNLFPYQCSKNPAIRDLFYRTYVVNSSSSPNQDSIGINKLSQKLKSSCDHYRKMMLDKFMQAQERAEKEKNQVIQNFKSRLCKCQGCQGCQGHQNKECQKIAKYHCVYCKKMQFCEVCVQFNKCGTEDCINRPRNFSRTEQIPFDYQYPDLHEFIESPNEKTT